MVNKKMLWPVLLSLVVLPLGFRAEAQEAQARYDMMKTIRRDKFDLVLPGAMRDNQVDMWIHVIRRGDPDPLSLDLGGQPGCPSPSLSTRCLGYYVFTDRGGDRIERALFNVSGDEDLYDVSRPADDLAEFVAERDPRRIAVNTSEWLTVADGLSHTGYLTLVNRLGEKYAKRLVSAENVINDFRARRIQTEIAAFAKACEMQRRIMEAAFARIEPGVTTREELGWWVQDQLLTRGLATLASGPSAPGVLLSGVPQAERGDAYHRGDLLVWDWGISYLNFGTDFKRHAYILRDGESGVPKDLQYAWDQGMKVREVIRRDLSVGRTAGDTLKSIGRALEQAGFGYVPNDPTTDGGFSGLKPGEHLKHPDKTEVSVDCHCVGNTGDSQVEAGPSIAPHRPDRARLIIQPNNLFAFEFVCYIPIPGWDGKKFRLPLEDNALITEKGVEALYPLNDRIFVIR